MNCWSKWLDYYLQKLTILIPAHINYINLFLNWLKEINNIPFDAFLFTSDAGSMYNNINTEHVIYVIENWLDKLSVPPNFPADLSLDAAKAAMKSIMRNNHFEF